MNELTKEIAKLFKSKKVTNVEELIAVLKESNSSFIKMIMPKVKE